VSRLGNPLVNELVIGLIDKDRFSRQHPFFDADPNIGFGGYVEYPSLPEVISTRYVKAVSSVLNMNFATLAPLVPRYDLVATFLTGIATVNKANTTFVGEVLRLNTGTGAIARGKQNNLGVVGTVLAIGVNAGAAADYSGFPNGRRPGDDVVDIALDVVMGALCAQPFLTAGLNLCIQGTSPAPIGGVPLTDGSPIVDTNYGSAFPYLNTPTPGSYLDGVAGNVVQNATLCYPEGQHGRCPMCVVDSEESRSCGAGSLGGVMLDWLNFF